MNKEGEIYINMVFPFLNSITDKSQKEDRDSFLLTHNIYVHIPWSEICVAF